MNTDLRKSSGSLSSGIAVVVALLLALVMLLVFIALLEQGRQRTIERIELTLDGSLMSAENQIRHDLARMRAEVRLLAQLPPIAGIGRAIAGGGYDAEGQSSQQLWLSRLADIFRAYAESDPNVRQVRLIGIADDGREIVRVERHGAFVRRVPGEQLQSKIHRPYVRRTITMPPGQIFVSGIELNREQGRLDVPHWATMRVATPAVGPGDTVYGVVVINFDADRLLANLRMPDNDWATIFVADAKGDFVVHPDPAKRFGSESGARHRIEDEFPNLARAKALDTMQLNSSAGRQRYVAMHVLKFDPTAFDGSLTLFASADESRVVQEARTQVRQLVPPLLVAAALILTLMFALLRRQLSPLHVLVAAARDVAANGEHPPLPTGYGGEIGELVAAFDAMRGRLQRKQEDSQELENRLRESEAFANAIIRGSPSGIVVVGDNGLIIRSNLAAERMFGHSSEQMHGNPVEMLVPDAQRARHATLRRTFDAAEQARPMVQRFGKLHGQRSDGSPFPAEIALANLLIHDRRYVIATINDVTEQHQRQMRSDMLASIVEHSSDFIFICTPYLECLHLNPTACRVVGLEGEPTESYHLSHFMVAPDRSRLGDEIAPCVAATGRWDGEVRMRHVDTGDPFDTHWQMFAIRETDGQTKALAVVAVALADQRARVAAEAASEAKSNFLAHMSHEMRTPLNAVLSVGHLISRTTLDPAQRRLIGQLERAGRHLAEMISDVLDLSKIEAGKLIITAHPFALVELLQEIAGLMSVQAAEKGIALGLDIDPTLPEEVVGDATRINQILGNLLSNAIKFTEHGRVELKAQVLELDESNVLIEFSVTDTGIGIEQKDIRRLFTPFTQADLGATRRFGGTGLGLAIVKRLAGAMGGEVGVDSEPGAGSRFWCRLMLTVADRDDAPDSQRAVGAGPTTAGGGAAADLLEPQLPGVRVLVVDDSDINRDIARQVLEIEGAEVRLAASGFEALEQLRGHAQHIDVILMDVQMPGLDGFETTQRIRRDPDLQHLPIIALTAAALPVEREKAVASGMRDFLTKPIDPPVMIDAIRHQLYAGWARPGAGARHREATSDLHWPEIDGIDGADTRARLGGDSGLLRTLLARLFSDFEDLQPMLALPAAAAQPRAFAGRMHKLKGIAANLGAGRIRQAAAALESALRQQQPRAVDDLVCEVCQALAALQEACAGFLASESSPAPGRDGPRPAAVHELIALLRHHDLAAGDACRALAGMLAGILDADETERLHRHIDALEFDAAASILEAKAIEDAAVAVE